MSVEKLNDAAFALHVFHNALLPRTIQLDLEQRGSNPNSVPSLISDNKV